MGNIVLLDDLTINQIAAGEVIERPASVVKELVENSIDAGATSISVEIRNGGISYIRIADNGKGIMPDDMEIAFERHATSKIRQAKDLETVKSMGFRGEALASIAAIARVEMISKTEENSVGYKIVVEGGNIISKEEIGCPKGTTITVQNLFFNTPVRYKFLKKDFTEFGYIEDTVTRIALINPNISIKLINSGKNVIQTSGNNDMKTVLYNIYGKDISQNSLEVDYIYEDIKVTGVVGKPTIARSNRSNQLFFVNKRHVKDKSLSSAADQSYKGLLPIGKFGFLILNLDIDPHKVDVNVHPAKLEVRFEEEGKVFKAIYHAIRETLLKDDLETDLNKIKNVNILKEEMTVQKQFVPNTKVNELKSKESTNTLIGNFFKKIMNSQNNNQENTKIVKKNVEIEDSNKKIEEEVINETSTAKENVKSDSNNEETTIKSMQDIEDKSEVEIKQKLNELEKLVNLEMLNNNEVTKKDENIGETRLIGYINDKETEVEKNIKENTNKELEVKSEIKKDSSEQTSNEVKVLENNLNNIVEKVHELEDTKMEADSASFEEMYAKMFGKLPKEEELQEENKLKEETEEYHFDNNDVENISLFSNSNINNIPNYKFIGIAFSTYIIIEMNKEMYIIDEYSMHERVIYEKIKNNYYSDGPKESQLMLLPDIITLTNKEMGIAKDNMKLFERAGFTLEEFGENTIKLTGVPSICLDLETKKLFLETLDEINTVVRTAKQEIEEKLISTLACKAARKSNMALNREDVDELMKELLILSNPFTGPQGKPIAIRISKAEIEKKFSRKK